MTEQQAKGASKGPGSFFIPRAAVEALLDANATAYEICAYLVLARFTDESGRYSTASISAVNRYTGANKTKGGPVDRAIERLKQIRATRTNRVLKKLGNGRYGKAWALVDKWVDEKADLGPILFERTAWQQQTGEILPDGPTERGLVRYVLPDFGEERESRVWFGNNFVGGVGGFTQPLKALKDAGTVAARLLLALYEVNDMETWGGVRPLPVGDGHGPWVHYEPVDTDTRVTGGARLHRAKRVSEVGSGDMFSRVCPFPEKPGSWWKAHDEASGPVWRALEALQSAGLVYEVVMVLNRNATKAKSSRGTEYSAIPEDAEPSYELDCRSKHGYKPGGEEGVGWATAKTASDLGKPVTLEGGRFDGTYAAFVPDGYPCMIAGIYRLRFRVSNPKNAGVKGAWAGIHQRNRGALELVNSIREANNLPALVPPATLESQQVAGSRLRTRCRPDGKRTLQSFQ
jgi:hypothetical protein